MEKKLKIGDKIDILYKGRYYNRTLRIYGTVLDFFNYNKNIYFYTGEYFDDVVKLYARLKFNYYVERQSEYYVDRQSEIFKNYEYFTHIFGNPETAPEIVWFGYIDKKRIISEKIFY